MASIDQSSVSFLAKMALNPPLTRARAMKSIGFSEFKKYLGLANEPVVDILVETHQDANNLRCYDNCAKLSTARWNPVCGWLMWVGLQDGVITAEHHCVLWNGERYKEVSPHHEASITFLPDTTFSPQAISKLANKQHCPKWIHQVVAGFQIRVVPHGRTKAVNISSSEDPSLPGVMWLYREDLRTVQNELLAAKVLKRKRNKKRRRRQK